MTLHYVPELIFYESCKPKFSDRTERKSKIIRNADYFCNKRCR